MSTTKKDVGTPGLARNEFEALHAFQGEQWRKLMANAHKGGWKDENVYDLLSRLGDEVRELEEAVHAWDLAKSRPITSSEVAADLAGKVAKEAADVGNFAMMVADVVGGLRYERRAVSG